MMSVVKDVRKKITRDRKKTVLLLALKGLCFIKCLAINSVLSGVGDSPEEKNWKC